jgi:hypothetical protein
MANPAWPSRILPGFEERCRLGRDHRLTGRLQPGRSATLLRISGGSNDDHGAPPIGTRPEREPVEPRVSVENLGEFPNLTDQGDEEQYPHPPLKPVACHPKSEGDAEKGSLMRTWLIAACLLGLTAWTAQAQQATPRSGAGEGSSSGMTTGPAANNPGGQVQGSPNSRATDCMPNDTRPDCQQAAVPGSRGENPMRDDRTGAAPPDGRSGAAGGAGSPSEPARPGSGGLPY